MFHSLCGGEEEKKINKEERNEKQKSGVSSSAGLSQPAVLHEALRRGVPHISSRHLTSEEKPHLTPRSPRLSQLYDRPETNETTTYRLVGELWLQ